MSNDTVTGNRAAERSTVDSGRLMERIGGYAGLLFGLGVLLQNGVLLQGNPMPDAPLVDIRSFYADGQGRIGIAVGLVALNVTFLLLFTSAMADRLDDGGGGRIAGRMGSGAAVLLAGAFLVTTATQALLTARVDDLAASGDLQAWWDFHSGAFAMSASALAAVLIAFSLGSWITGRLLPRWACVVGAAGAVALIVAGALVVPTLDGGPGIFIQLLGFASWVIVLVTGAVRLVRGD